MKNVIQYKGTLRVYSLAGDHAMQSDDSDMAKIVSSYYAGQNSRAYGVLQSSRFKSLLQQWEGFDHYVGNAVWNYDSFSQIQVLDQDMKPLYPEEQLYYCTFSGDDNRYGYAIFRFDASGPALQKYGLTETPYPYDLRENMETFAEQLKQTDIDLASSSATRMSWYDREKKRSDQVILFTDGKGDSYLGYFDDEIVIEKI